MRRLSMPLRRVGQRAFLEIANFGKHARAWSAKNAYLVGFLLLLAGSSFLVFAVRDQQPNSRDADSVLVLGSDWVGDKADRPIFSLSEGSKGRWFVSIRGSAPAGGSQKFRISTRRQAETPLPCWHSNPADCFKAASTAGAASDSESAPGDCSASIATGWANKP